MTAPGRADFGEPKRGGVVPAQVVLKRKPTLVLLAATAGCLVVATGVVLRRDLVELWYLSRLEHGATESRQVAARWLGEHRSRRAIPGLIACLRSGDDTAGDPSVYREALVAIGAPSAGALQNALREGDIQLRWHAALTLRALFKSLGGPLRRDLAAALGRGDALVAERLNEEIVRLPVARPEDWLALARFREERKDWPAVLDCYDGALALIRRLLTTPLGEKIVNRPDSPQAQRTRAASTLAYYDWTWNQVRDPVSARLLIERRDAELASTQIDLELARGRLLRDRIADYEAALAAFRSVLPRDNALFTSPILELCQLVCKRLRDSETVGPWKVANYAYMTALGEIAETRLRMPPSRRGLEDLVRRLLVSPDPVKPKHRMASELAWHYHRVARVEEVEGPPSPLIELLPGKETVVDDVQHPAPGAMPFFAFVNKHMDVRDYAFVAPPGYELETASLSAAKGAILLPFVRSWAEASRHEESTLEEYRPESSPGDAGDTVRYELTFRPQSGILIVEVNNARDVRQFRVRATFRAREGERALPGGS